MPDSDSKNESIKRCVYTTMIGGYEKLNEQPIAATSTIPFICLTDDPTLRSTSWEIRLVSPSFGMDSVRSQRDIKIRPHLYLPDYDISLYIDNTVLLTQPPETLFERYPSSSGFSLPKHSFRDTIFDEFLQVAALGLDKPTRILEQLDHYTADHRGWLLEKPYWTAILFRDQRNPEVRAMLETWAAHVLRYSQRDQLSVNIAFNRSGLQPEAIKIDNHSSWFHTWPNALGRKRTPMMQTVVTPAGPGNDCVMTIKREILKQLQQASRGAPASSAARDSAQQSCETLAMALSMRTAVIVHKGARKHPKLARATWRSLTLAKRAVTSRPHRWLLSAWSHPAQRRRERAFAAATGLAVRSVAIPNRSRTIYVNPSDRRGLELIARDGNLNPSTLTIWKRLLRDCDWTHIIDIGANYGEMLLNVDVPPHSKVIAVEPNTQLLPYLERSLRESGIDARVVRSAVAEREGTARLLIDKRWSGNTRLQPDTQPFETANSGSPHSTSGTLTVATTTLAALLEERDSRAIRALVKIDVEGRELNVLKGGLDKIGTLERFAAVIEILHLGTDDLRWILDRFTTSLLDLGNETFVDVVPATVEQLHAMIRTGRFHPQDAVIRPPSPQSGA